MKTLNELLAEKEGYRKNIKLFDEKIQNFDKPTTITNEEFKQYKAMLKAGENEDAQSHYIKLKAKYAKNEQELNELEKQLDVNRLSNNLINCNIIIVFSNLYKNKIIQILNKYVKKRVGEKTKDKIEEEIKALDKNINHVYINTGEYIHNNYVYMSFSKFDLKIEFTKNIKDNWLNEKKELINNIDNVENDNYSYIDNIKELAIQKINDKKKIKKEVEEQIEQLKKKVREFNNFYCKNEKEFKIDEYSIFR